MELRVLVEGGLALADGAVGVDSLVDVSGGEAGIAVERLGLVGERVARKVLQPAGEGLPGIGSLAHGVARGGDAVERVGLERTGGIGGEVFLESRDGEGVVLGEESGHGAPVQGLFRKRAAGVEGAHPLENLGGADVVLEHERGVAGEEEGAVGLLECGLFAGQVEEGPPGGVEVAELEVGVGGEEGGLGQARVIGVFPREEALAVEEAGPAFILRAGTPQ